MCIVDALTDDEDKICELDWTARIFGSEVSETIKSMIHPLPLFRNHGGYALHNANEELDDKEFNFHISIPSTFQNLKNREQSTIVVSASWAVPIGDQGDDEVLNEREDVKTYRSTRRITYCSVGSVSFRRQLDLPPDRVYVERIYLQPRYRGMVRWLLRRALQKTCSMFEPALSRDMPVELIILVANSMEQNLIATSFPGLATQMDKNHVKIVKWHIHDDNNDPRTVGHGRI